MIGGGGRGVNKTAESADGGTAGGISVKQRLRRPEAAGLPEGRTGL